MGNLYYTNSSPNPANEYLHIPLMAVSTHDEGNFTYNGIPTVIGDTAIGVSFSDGSGSVVGQIRMIENYSVFPSVSMRSTSPTKTSFSTNIKTFEISGYFYGRIAVFGGAPGTPWYELHPNSLAALIAQFKRMPIIPIDDSKIHYEHGVNCVALHSLQIYVDRAMPGAVKFVLTCTEVDYSLYCNSAQSYATSIIWPLWRWHWRNYYRELAPGEIFIPTKGENHIEYTPISNVSDHFNGILDIYVADTDVLDERLDDVLYKEPGDKKDQQKAYRIPAANEVPYTRELSFKRQGEPGNLDYAVLTTISVSMRNVFAIHEPSGLTTCYAQFMGAGDTTTSLIITAPSNLAGGFDNVTPIQMLLDKVSDMNARYRAVLSIAPCIICNEIINLCGVRAVVQSNDVFETQVGMPGIEQISIDFASFDIDQHERSRAVKVYKMASNGKVGFDDYMSTDIDGYRLNENSRAFYRDWGKYMTELCKHQNLFNEVQRVDITGAILRSSISPWYGKIYEQIALEALEQAEVYPDLHLPTFNRLMTDLSETAEGKVNYFDIKTGDAEDLNIIHNIMLHCAMMDALWWKGGRFVDPDFYVDYPKRITSREKLHEISAEFFDKDRKALLKEIETEIEKNADVIHKGAEEIRKRQKQALETLTQETSIKDIENNIVTAMRANYPDRNVYTIAALQMALSDIPANDPILWNEVWAGDVNLYIENNPSLKTKVEQIRGSILRMSKEEQESIVDQVKQNMKDMVELGNHWDKTAAQYGIYGTSQWPGTPESNTMSDAAKIRKFKEVSRYNGPYSNIGLACGMLIANPATVDMNGNPYDFVNWELNKIAAEKINKFLNSIGAYATVLDSMNDVVYSYFNNPKVNRTKVFWYGKPIEKIEDAKITYKDTIEPLASIDATVTNQIVTVNGELFPFSKDNKEVADEIKQYFDTINSVGVGTATVVDRDGSGNVYAYNINFGELTKGLANEKTPKIDFPDNLKNDIKAILEDATMAPDGSPSVGYMRTFTGGVNKDANSPAALEKIMNMMSEDFKGGPKSGYCTTGKEQYWNDLARMWNNVKVQAGGETMTLEEAWKGNGAGPILTPANNQAMKNIVDGYCSIRIIQKDESKKYAGSVLGATLSEVLGHIDTSRTADQIMDLYPSMTSMGVRVADTFQDQLAEPTGRLIKAFPTYAAQIMEEGPKIKWRKYLPIFWNMGSLAAIEIVHSDRNPTSLCRLTMSDAFRNYTNIGVMQAMNENLPQLFRMKRMKSIKDIITSDGLVTIGDNQNTFITSFIYSLGFSEASMIGRVFGEHEETDMIRARLKSYYALMLQPDHRIHVRMGYGSNARALPVVFNGTIDTVEDGSTTYITAIGDGIELVNKINRGFSNQDVVNDSLNLPEPRESILAMMNSHHEHYFMNGLGDRFGRIWHQLMFVKSGGNLYSDDGLGITHFGCPIYHRLSTSMLGEQDDWWSMFKDPKELGVDKGTKDKGNAVSLAAAATAGISTAVVGGIGLATIGIGLNNALGNPVGNYVGNYFARTQGTLGFGAPGETGENIYSSFSAINRFDYEKFKRILEGNDTKGESISRMEIAAQDVALPSVKDWGDKRNLLGLLHMPRFREGINFKVKDKSPWDIISTYATAYPPYIATTRPFEYRSTLFFGAPYYTYRYDYIRTHSNTYDSTSKQQPNFIKNYEEPKLPVGTSVQDTFADIYDKYATKYKTAGASSFDTEFVHLVLAELRNAAGDMPNIDYNQLRDVMLSDPAYGVRPEYYKGETGKEFLRRLSQYNGTKGKFHFWGGYTEPYDSGFRVVNDEQMKHLTAPQELWSAYKRLQTVGLPVAYMCKPLNQMFIDTTSTNILSNSIQCSSDDIATSLSVRYYGSKFDQSRTHEFKVYLDKDIYPQLRKHHFVDADVVGFGPLRTVCWSVLSVLYSIYGTAANVYNEVAGKISKNPDNVYEYSTRERMKHYARALLRDSVKDMYKGAITVTGAPRRYPFCQSYLYDQERAMFGMVDIGRVSHVMSMTTGYVTIYEPKLKAYVKGDHYNEYLTSILSAVGSRAIAYYVARNNAAIALRSYYFVKWVARAEILAGLSRISPDWTPKVVSEFIDGVKGKVKSWTKKPLEWIQTKTGEYLLDITDYSKYSKQISEGVIYDIDAVRKMNIDDMLKGTVKSDADRIMFEAWRDGAKQALRDEKLLAQVAEKIAKGPAAEKQAAKYVESAINREVALIAEKRGLASISSKFIKLKNTSFVAGLSTVWGIAIFIATSMIVDSVLYLVNEYLDSFTSLVLFPLKRKGYNYVAGISGYKQEIMISPDFTNINKALEHGEAKIDTAGSIAAGGTTGIQHTPVGYWNNVIGKRVSDIANMLNPLSYIKVPEVGSPFSSGANRGFEQDDQTSTVESRSGAYDGGMLITKSGQLQVETVPFDTESTPPPKPNTTTDTPKTQQDNTVQGAPMDINPDERMA